MKQENMPKVLQDLATLSMLASRTPENRMAVMSLSRNISQYLNSVLNTAGIISDLKAQLADASEREMELIAQIEKLKEEQPKPRRARRKSTEVKSG